MPARDAVCPVCQARVGYACTDVDGDPITGRTHRARRRGPRAKTGYLWRFESAGIAVSVIEDGKEI